MAKFISNGSQKANINMNAQNKNVIINLPPGTGKNITIIYSFEENKRYLILVPRIILTEQLKNKIIKHKPELQNKIQLINKKKRKFNNDKIITICVFNAVSVIKKYAHSFEKIYVCGAHHINKPKIYCYDNDELVDDAEDELIGVKNYVEIIKSFTRYNNNVYLSATIDRIDGFEYYGKDIREMINSGYVCDYTINIPIFPANDDMKICKHLLTNYRNIIIYCDTQKEGKIINDLMNSSQKNCSMYIDCKTPKKERNDIIDKYNNGEFPFLVNAHILAEGFDSPITKGVCFMHLSSNKTTPIQIMGNALRVHPLKQYAKIILPVSTMEDGKNVCKFLKIMATYDSRIRQSYENKQLGGYIEIDIIDDKYESEEEKHCDDDDEAQTKYNMIYNSMTLAQL